MPGEENGCCPVTLTGLLVPLGVQTLLDSVEDRRVHVEWAS
jgi:hypothetical protein